MSLPHDRRLQLAALLGVLPGLILALLMILARTRPPLWAMGLGFAAAIGMSAAALHGLRTRVLRPLQTLANLLAALREGDYSFRARVEDSEDPLGHVFGELNTLSELLQRQRLKALEATALLRAVMAEIDVAVFAFDAGGALRLANRAAEQLLGRDVEALLGATAAELGLEAALAGGASPMDLDFPGRSGRFECRRARFREGGQPHRLLVLSDLTRTLREEERQAWQRLIRVLGHEINNSLAPIQSLAGSIATFLARKGEDWEADARQGLAIIEGRAQGLGRFMEAYTRLARLPSPERRAVALDELVRKVAGLEARAQVILLEGPPLVLQADPDQLEQALINLLCNAADAVQAGGGAVRLGWARQGGWVELKVEDEGPGLPEGGNLFVPFFTTKPGGSGIGLVLARQIAEGHGGSLFLSNRPGGGAVALMRLPL